MVSPYRRPATGGAARRQGTEAIMPGNNTVRVLARNVSGGAFDLGAATLSVAATKRRIP
jgi:hypothetical protein